jgi:NAD(P)-dependent dehydrogenase (short-subunit alcohol dehydrogenase family)
MLDRGGSNSRIVRVDPQPLKNQVIVVVGGTSGLGLSGAQACAAAGAAVVAVGRDGAKGSRLHEQFGDRVRIVEGDATDPETAVKAIQEAMTAFRRCDGLYHVAGGSGRSHGDGPLDQLSDAGWEFTLRLNLDSLFYSNRAAVQHFLRQGRGGVILNMASVLAFAPSPRYFATHAYAAAKAAIIGLTKAAAASYAPQNIRINAVAPALVETPMAQRAVGNEAIRDFVRHRQPLDGGRVGQPTDVDQAVVYLLSDHSRFVTGQVLAIDGGWSVSDAARMYPDEQAP